MQRSSRAPSRSAAEGVQRFDQRSIHIITLANFHRGEQTGQGSACQRLLEQSALYSNQEPQTARFVRMKISRHQEELLAQLAEIIRRPAAGTNSSGTGRCGSCRKLPLVSPLQAAEAIRQRRPRRIPIVMIAARSRPGSEAKRCMYSLHAGRNRMSGSNGSSCAALAMNIRYISRGDNPLASPAAMKPPELTPT